MSGDAATDIGFPTLLRGLRVAAGMTQRDLAQRSGISRTTINDLEAGRVHAPQDATIAMLSEALGLDAADRARLVAAAGGRGRRIPEAVRRSARLPNRARIERGHALLGRDAELRALEGLLRDGGLVTVTGAGGIGKSRLALEAAARAEAAGRPAFVVALESLDRQEDLLPAVAAAIGAPAEAASGPDAPARLASQLPAGSLLLLDDADRIQAAAGEIAALAAVADAAVLVTSRQPLGVRGERVFPVPPLAAPDPATAATDPAALAANPAVALFRERAAAAGHPVTDAQVPEVAGIVAALDGMPLAIELAAAQLHALEPAQILALLDAAGPRLLVRSAADTGDRQRAMSAAIAWSADLLPQPARELFAALGAFRGGVSGEALAAVLAKAGEPEALAALPDLVRANLVFAAEGHDRWSMLEPVRYVAMERLDASPRAQEIRRAHARWYARWAARLGAEVFGPRMETALAAEAADRANAVAAARWALGAGEVELAARIEDGLWRIWDMVGQAALWRSLVEPIAGRAAEIDDPLLRSFARFHLATCTVKYGDPAPIRQRIAAIAREEPGDRIAWALGVLARSISRLETGSPELPRELREARAVLLATGHPQALTVPALELAGALATRGEIPEALALLDGTVALMEREGNRFELPLALQVLAEVRLAIGDGAAARDALLRAAALHRPGHPPARLAMTVALLALAFGMDGDPASRRLALRLAGASEAWYERVGLPLPEHLPERFAAMVAAVSPDVGAVDVEALLAEGRGLSLEEANALALAWPPATR